MALALLRDGFKERSITQRTAVPGGTLYRLAIDHGITAPHGTVEGHRCHEAADTEPCDECSLADGRDQARKRARHRRSGSPAAAAGAARAPGSPWRTPRR
ncbi:hypothetical protein ABZ864_45060 [Streptomyces sp. NPDC047082]|uniref:hypothetical protein n=1 Tax=Streptomyces sp. NPDC047082 TaxID=3155259 RepID=UPI0034035EA4